MIDTENIKLLVDESKNYLETKIELSKLEAAEKLSDGIAKSSSLLIIGGFTLVFLMIFSIFLSLFIGNFFDNYLYGFGLVSAFYLLAIIITLIFKNKILKYPIQNMVITYFFKKNRHAK